MIVVKVLVVVFAMDTAMGLVSKAPVTQLLSVMVFARMVLVMGSA